MSGLVNNPNVKPKIVPRKPEYRPENPLTNKDIDGLKETKKVSNSNTQIGIDSVTYSSSIRIDNHIKNQLQSMAIVGFADSQKDAIELLITNWRETLTDEQRRTLDSQAATLERKDLIKKSKK